MGLFDVFNKEKRRQAHRKNEQVKEGIQQFVVIKEVQEILAKGNSLQELGRGKEANEKFNEAIRVAKRGIEMDPKSVMAKKTLCNIYLQLESYDLAEKHFKWTLQEHANDPQADLTEVYTRLGVLQWYGKKDTDGGIRYFNKALKAAQYAKENLEPDPRIHSEPHLYLGQICFERGDNEKAKKHCQIRLKYVEDCQMASMLYEALQ